MTEALLPVAARVHGLLRAHPPAGRAARRQGHRHAPRAHEPGRRDRRRRGRPAPLGGDRPGAQRRGRAHGRAVRPAGLGPRPRPPARPGRTIARSTVDSSSAGGGCVDATGDARGPTSLVEDGRVARGGRRRRPGAPTSTLDAGGCVVAPGLVDLHTHLRQPGKEEAETVETGARAAALGGFTCVLAMPNTDPGDRLGRRGPRGARAGPGRGVRGAHVGRHHGRPGGRAADADGRAGRRSACGSSPTTATACRTPASCAGPSSTPAAWA